MTSTSIMQDPVAEAQNASTLDWELYFSRPDTPSKHSPGGNLMVRIAAKYPELDFEQAYDRAKGALHMAARRYHYHLPSIKSLADLYEEEQKAVAKLEQIAVLDTIHIAPNTPKTPVSSVGSTSEPPLKGLEAIEPDTPSTIPCKRQKRVEPSQEAVQPVLSIGEQLAVNRAVEKENSQIVFMALPDGARDVPNPATPRLRSKMNRSRKEQLIAEQGGKCFFCERPFGIWVRKGSDGVPQQLKAEEEHFIPRGELGSRAEANIHVACHLCNRFKARRCFPTVESSSAWLKQMWEANGYTHLGRLLYQKFENGEHIAAA